jgi:predicted anti-sigma-YlaC factor YlaD
MECREVREYLPAYGEQAGDPRATFVDQHLATCAGCSAELSQYRELAGALGGLADLQTEPPAWMLGTLVETVGSRATQLAALRQRREKLTDPKVVTGGALVAAGLVGALVMRSMRRRRRSVWRRVQESMAEA